MQHQQADGTLECITVDAPAADISCDVDGGDVDIVGGRCVSKVKCDPATTSYDPATGECVGMASSSSCPPCSTPDEREHVY